MADVTTLQINREDRELLQEIADKNDWSISATTRRAVHALFALYTDIEAMSEREGGQVGRVLALLGRDLDPALLLHPKPMSKVEGEDGTQGVEVDEFTFFEGDDCLFARRELDGRVEVYEVRDGRLVLVYPTAAAVAALN